MPRTVTVGFDDGSTHVYQGVPDDATPDSVEERAGQDFAGKKVISLDGGAGPPPEAGPIGLQRGLTAEGQLALSAATHLVSGPLARGAAGLVARVGNALRLTDTTPDQAHALADKYAVYNTPEGSDARAYTDAMTRAVAPILGPVGNALTGVANTADQFIGKYGGAEAQKVARQAAGTGGDIMGVAPLAGAVGEGVSALRSAAAPVAEAATVARTPDELAAAGGYQIPPSVQGATTGAAKPNVLQSALEAVGDRSTVRRGDILTAKAATNTLGKQALGLSDDKLLSPATLAEAEAPYAAVYRQTEAAIPNPIDLAGDKAYQADIAQAGARADSLRPIPAAVEKERAGAAAIDQANGPQLMATISDYRAKGYKALQSDDVDQQAVGHAQLDIANALEARMGRALPDPDMAAQFQQAREGFAKVNTVRNSLVGHDIDPQMVRKLADKNSGITGELGYIADMAEKFPKILTLNVPSMSGNVLGHGIGMGLLGTAGYHLGGAEGMLGGMAAAPVGQYYARKLLGALRPVSEDPQVTLGSALADYAKQRGGAFPPSLTGFAVPGPRGGAVATVPGQNYNVPARPAPPTLQTNQGLNPQDQALADAVAARHPGAPRPAPLALPAPGQLAPRPAAVAPVAPRVTLQHPGSPKLSSTVTQAAQRARIQHMIDVLSARGAGAQ